MKIDAVSPLAPDRFPDLPPIAGLDAAVGRAGFYKHERPDLLLMRMPAGTRAAGVFTTNAVGSAPTDWCKQALAATRGSARGLLVNAGCANSFTGPAGDAACKRALEEAGAAIGVETREMLAASTGVIGVVLDDSKIAAALPKMTSFSQYINSLSTGQFDLIFNVFHGIFKFGISHNLALNGIASVDDSGVIPSAKMEPDRFQR